MGRQDRASEIQPTTKRTLHSPGPRPPAPASACVVVIHGEGLGRRADIRHAGIVIGRSHEADLCIDHLSVSRAHCRIDPDGDTFKLTDLGATNPTLLNEQPASEARLQDGDHITVGESILKFIGDASVEGRYHEEVYQLATHDPLTNLYNRRHFAELAEKEIARTRRHGRPLVMGIIDVDLFKAVNDRHGHIAGDGVLAEVALIVRNHLRGEDIAARIGGEEFAILLPESDLAAASHFAERLRRAVAGTGFSPGGETHTITVSIGLTRYGPERDSFSLLMRCADTALYSAKRNGRNRVESLP